jgi:hypothetical protein
VANGPSDGAAELVDIELGSCGVKVALGVEVGIADKLEERSVEIVGAGFCGDQNCRAGARAKFGGV